jgi:hypothetical protein
LIEKLNSQLKISPHKNSSVAAFTDSQGADLVLAPVSIIGELEVLETRLQSGPSAKKLARCRPDIYPV